jgi:hypothetical protein
MFIKNIFLAFLFSIYFFSNTSAEILSHKATYSLLIQNIKDGSFLEGGQGQTYFEIKKGCEGWNVREDYVLIYDLPNKKTSNSLSAYSTFENFAGTKHSFELNDDSQFSGKNAYEGYVEKNKSKIQGYLIKDNIKSLSFNKDLLFPVEHLRKIIQKAESGEKLYTQKVFFGNEDKEFVKTVSAFIGKKKQSTSQDFKFLSNSKVWPMKIAFYSQNSRKGDPDYEIKLDLDDKGIAHYYEVDYGDFEIKATLKRFERIKEKKCN